jgi:hypothetical protein
MTRALLLLAGLATAGGCVADPSKGVEDDVPVGGKADSFRDPTEHGELVFGPPSRGELDPEDARYHAWTFTLSAPAHIRLWTGSPDNLDTVMYLYHRTGDDEGWGRYEARDDDGGEDALSMLDSAVFDARGDGLVDAGQYRIIVKGFKTIYRGRFTLTGQCEGDGCPGGGTDVDPPLPTATGFTTSCLDKLHQDLRSEAWFADELTVQWDHRSTLDGTKRLAVGYFAHLLGEIGEDSSDLDHVYVTYVGTRNGGSVVEVTTGADWSYEFTFDGDGDLVMYYFNDQSPYSEYYCGEAGEETISEPTEFCAGKFADYFPYDPDTGMDFEETYRPDEPNDEIGAWAWAALGVYRTAVGIGEDVEVSMNGAIYDAHEWGTTAEVAFSAPGKATITYYGGDGEYGSPWVLTAQDSDGALSLVCHEE